MSYMRCHEQTFLDPGFDDHETSSSVGLDLFVTAVKVPLLAAHNMTTPPVNVKQPSFSRANKSSKRTLLQITIGNHTIS